MDRCQGRLRSVPRTLLVWLLMLLSALSPVALAATRPSGPGAAAELAEQGSLPMLRKVPGPSPRQTIENFLGLTDQAEQELRSALSLGMAQPGPFFSANINQRVNGAVDELQQATQALDLSEIPAALRPMTGVATMLQLRSLLRYDLARSPGLVLLGGAETRQQKLQIWTIPDTPISLRAVTPAEARQARACQQCSADDFLFSSETLEQVPDDFQRIFGGNPGLRRQFGADLYTYWALLPGGAIPPKWFFALPRPLHGTLLMLLWGQSLLQWLLLLPVTLAVLALMAWWLLMWRVWNQRVAQVPGLWPHLWRLLAVLPPLLLLSLWQWYAIDWINLIGPRQEAVLVGSRVLRGLLDGLLVYLAAEALGQACCLQRQRDECGRAILTRRKGSGQILTIARCAGLLGALVVAVRTGQDLGLTSFTLLAVWSVPALAISLGTQQLIHDIADGFSLLFDGQIKPGDRCTIGTAKSGEIRGRILSLGMRSVRLEQEDGSVIALPNSQLASSVLTNHRFRTNQLLQLSLPINASEESEVQGLLDRARVMLEQLPELGDGQAELEAVDSGWQLKLPPARGCICS